MKQGSIVDVLKRYYAQESSAKPSVKTEIVFIIQAIGSAFVVGVSLGLIYLTILLLIRP